MAGRAASGFNTALLVWAVAGLTCLLLLGLARLGGSPLTGVPLAISIALAIGLHNLGEGLAIGSAFASGAAALGGYLLLGFTLHNVTEGVGIVAPLLDRRPALLLLAGLACLAGLPAVVGMWLGAFAFSSHWAAVALAVGAGAILQVLIEVGLLLGRDLAGAGGRGYPITLAGLTAGVAVMYGTALLVPV
jgi:zinc transporter, ZIP family